MFSLTSVKVCCMQYVIAEGRLLGGRIGGHAVGAGRKCAAMTAAPASVTIDLLIKSDGGGILLSIRRQATTAMFALTASSLLIAGCGTAKPAAQAAQKPVTIGTSLSLSGDFSGDGKSIEAGYKLWVDQVNKHGGLLGRKVKLVVLNDDSSTQQSLTNYSTLIGTDHVDLVFGPFSSPLTIPAEQIAKRYGYLLPDPAGGAPSVFAENYDGYAYAKPASVPHNLLGLGNLLMSLPASERPKTVAYATSNDPFTEPQLPPLRKELEAAGMRTLYYQVFPDETPDLQPEALAIAQTHADAVVLGTTSVPQVQAFVQAFAQQHYNPKVIVATSGPDQGSAFSSALGVANTEGFLVPIAWTPTANSYQNKQFIQAYIAKYGGTAASIPADAPDAYCVGQLVQELVTKTHSLKNADLIKALHANTFQTVEGPMSFQMDGAPAGTHMFLVQWQNGSTKIVWPKDSQQASLEYPKPAWH